jgi:hypothetical protein
MMNQTDGMLGLVGHDLLDLVGEGARHALVVDAGDRSRDPGPGADRGNLLGPLVLVVLPVEDQHR